MKNRIEESSIITANVDENKVLKQLEKDVKDDKCICPHDIFYQGI